MGQTEKCARSKPLRNAPLGRSLSGREPKTGACPLQPDQRPDPSRHDHI
jgi:hypothetical protein